MRKLQVLGAVLAALFALAVLTASSASAAVSFLLAEWLKGGVGITATELTDIEGELLLEETVLGLKVAAVCSGIFDGSIGPNGADEITELLTLGGVLVSKELEETSGLACTNEENCPEPLAWANNLPWLTLAVLMVDGTEEFMVDLLSAINGEVGYHLICMGSSTSDLCKAPEGGIAKLTNEANGTVDGEFSEAFTTLSEFKLANCELAGNETGIVEGLGFTLLTAGGTLAVSE